MDMRVLQVMSGVFIERFDYGGMFEGTDKVVHDPETDTYAAFSLDGWNAGYGKRHKTFDDAKADLPRLRKKLFE